MLVVSLCQDAQHTVCVVAGLSLCSQSVKPKRLLETWVGRKRRRRSVAERSDDSSATCNRLRESFFRCQVIRLVCFCIIGFSGNWLHCVIISWQQSVRWWIEFRLHQSSTHTSRVFVNNVQEFLETFNSIRVHTYRVKEIHSGVTVIDSSVIAELHCLHINRPN